MSRFVVLFAKTQEDQWDVFELRVLNLADELVDEYSSNESRLAFNGVSAATFMSKAYHTARQQAMGVSEALDDLLDALEGRNSAKSHE